MSKKSLLRVSGNRTLSHYFKKTKASTSAVQVLKEHEGMLAQECAIKLNELGETSHNLNSNWEREIVENAEFIIQVSKGREALRTVISDMRSHTKNESSSEIKCQVSSLLLLRSWKYLVSDSQRFERLHLVTGTITDDGTRVLSAMEMCEFGQQSPAYVSAEPNDSKRVIISLAEDFGHLVLAMFHSHPGRGASSTHPSSVDDAFLKRMEKIGSDCIGGIFSIDGFVRFFAPRNFEMQVYGKGVELVEDKGLHKTYTIEEKEHHLEI